MIATSTIAPIVTVLNSKITTLNGYITTAGDQAIIDEHSSTGFFGIPESLVEELNKCIDIINVAISNVQTVLPSNLW